MARKIKGIVVEIGGDTTKLDEALSDINKQLGQTQQDLKDVERLLKLDPTNVTLLEQKQRLLTEAVGDTSKKLETLKTAAQQANDALKKGEIIPNGSSRCCRKWMQIRRGNFPQQFKRKSHITG